MFFNNNSNFVFITIIPILRWKDVLTSKEYDLNTWSKESWWRIDEPIKIDEPWRVQRWWKIDETIKIFFYFYRFMSCWQYTINNFYRETNFIVLSAHITYISYQVMYKQTRKTASKVELLFYSIHLSSCTYRRSSIKLIINNALVFFSCSRYRRNRAG